MFQMVCLSSYAMATLYLHRRSVRKFLRLRAPHLRCTVYCNGFNITCCIPKLHFLVRPKAIACGADLRFSPDVF